MKGLHKPHMSQGFHFGLGGLILSSWGNDMRIDMVVAKNIHHSFYSFIVPIRACYSSFQNQGPQYRPQIVGLLL